MAKEKTTIKLSPYLENIHKTGVIWFLVVYAFIIAFPVATCIIFKAWPPFVDFLNAAMRVVPLYWAVGFIEAFSYMPMLGAGGSYLGFVTGNMYNIKVPASVNALTSLNIKPSSEEGDCISTIAIAVSSIVTTLIVAIFVIAMVPLTPIFSNPVLKPAFDNVVPALFGGMMVAYLAKDTKVGLPIILLGAALFIAFPALAGLYPVVLPVLAGLAIFLARKLYVKGKL